MSVKGLDNADKRRVTARIERVRAGELGDVKMVRAGISELRLYFGSHYRIYFATDTKTKEIVLLTGGKKDTQDKNIVQAEELFTELKNTKSP